MSDRECFDFLKSINYEKQWFIDRGWTLEKDLEDVDDMPRRYARWWPDSYTRGRMDGYQPLPPGFKLIEGYDNCYDDGLLPGKCCAYCKNSRSETSYGCKLPEVRTAFDSTILKGADNICPGHSNPVFVWSVDFAPHAICDYFIQREFYYNI